MAHGVGEEIGTTPMSLALQATLVRAREYASAQSHVQVTLEHLLLALTEDEDAFAVLQASRLDLGRLRNDVSAYLGDLDERAPPGTTAAPAISSALGEVLGYATLAAKQGRRQNIDGAIVLAALIGDGRSMAASFLTAQGLTFQEAVRVLQQGSAPTAQTAPDPLSRPAVPTASALRRPGAPGVRVQPAKTEDILAAARERVEMRTYPPADRAQPPAAPLATPQEPTAPVADRLPEPELPGQRPEPDGGVHQVPAALRDEPTLPIPSARLTQALPPHQPQQGLGPPALPAPGGAPGVAPTWAPPPLPLPRERALPPRNTQPAPAAFAPPSQPVARPAAEPNRDGPMPAPWVDPSPDQAATQRGRPQYASPPPAQGDGPRASTMPANRRQPEAAPHGVPRAPYDTAPRQPPLDGRHVSHTVPRILTAGRPTTVEVRIVRPPIAGGPAGNLPVSLRPEHVAIRAISVRLRPAKPGTGVEGLSPETQWDQGGGPAGRLGGETAVWRFSVTPRSIGKADLQLVVSARTVGADGVLADTALPDQVLEVTVRRDWAAFARRAGVLLAIALVSIVAEELIEEFAKFDLARFVRGLLRL